MAGRGASKGRCSGCGKTGSHCSIAAHTLDCPKWQALYAADPSAVLEPGEAYQRWVESGRADERAVRREQAVTANEEWRTRQAGRFARSRDLQEEDLIS